MKNLYSVLLGLFLILNAKSQDNYFPIFLDSFNINQRYIYAIGAFDVDNDYDNDLIVNYKIRVQTPPPFPQNETNYRTFVFENRGNRFMDKRSIGVTNAIAADFYHEDLDGDLVDDLVYSTYIPPDIISFYNFGWSENKGNFTFGPLQKLFNYDSQKLVGIVTSIADFNNDDLLDIVASYRILLSDFPTQVNEYFLGWFENLGQGNFSDKKTIESIYSSYTLIDINNDGVKDMIVNGASFKKLINDGAGNFTYGGLLNIPGLSGSQILSVGDVDADGVEDLIVYANSVLAWYKNDGTGNYVVPNYIDNVAHGSRVVITDVNSDGDVDLVCISSNNELVFYENDGTETFTKKVLGTVSETNKRLEVVDIDNDGNQEIFPGGITFGTFNYFKIIEPSLIVEGNIFYDQNANGIFDNNEFGISNTNVTILPDNLHVFIQDDGNYVFRGESGETYEVVFDGLENWELSTDSASYHVTLPQDSAQLYNFGLVPAVAVNNVESNVSTTNIRCSEQGSTVISIKNTGTTTLNGLIEFVFDSLTTMSSVYPNISSSSGNKLYWNLANFGPFQHKTFNVMLNMPNFNSLGESLDFTVNIYIEDEFDVITDTFTSTKNVILLCSYDPNDKNVSPPGVGEFNETLNDEELTYTIRFQNTGNASANNVTIYDTLDIALDLSTFSVINKSHYVETTMDVPNRAVKFHFPNIDLPDSTTNLIGSNGFVTYKIRPIENLDAAITVENTAHIVFDFNPAIVTNTVYNTLVSEIGVITNIYEELDNQVSLTMYPNPMSQTSLLVLNSTFLKSYTAVIYDINGRKVQEYPIEYQNELRISRQDLKSGAYIIKLFDENNKALNAHYKFIVY
jgi:uncharacterized repeat protein (TIGR01451 family)